MNEQAAKKSRELFNSGYYCAESVLMAIAESRNVQSDLMPRIATGFCSGMARTGGQALHRLGEAIIGNHLTRQGLDLLPRRGRRTCEFVRVGRRVEALAHLPQDHTVRIFARFRTSEGRAHELGEFAGGPWRCSIPIHD